jgi:hypothetical protein
MMAIGGEKPRMVSDVRIGENVTISVVPRTRVEEEGDPFSPSRKINRSPTIGRPNVELLEDSEGSVGMSDHVTPATTSGGAYAKQLARRVAENNARAKQARIGTPEEAEHSTRDDTMTSDVDDGEVMISRAELKGFTQALTGAVQMLNLLLKKCRLDKDKDESIREVGNLIKGTLSFLEQCGEMETRRRKRRKEPVEVSYAEACRNVPSRVRMEELYSDESEGWLRVERRRREKRTPLIQEAPRAQPKKNREAALENRGAPRGRRRREALLIKIEEGSEWLQVYKRIMAARNTLEGATGVRTRAGHILIEFDRAVSVNEAAAKLRAALSDSTEMAALVNRATLQNELDDMDEGIPSNDRVDIKEMFYDMSERAVDIIDKAKQRSEPITETNITNSPCTGGTDSFDLPRIQLPTNFVA